jgi:hypothetical protein
LLTRQQILTQFDLRAASLDYLLGEHSEPMLDSSFRSEAGRRVIDLTEKDVFALQSARNSVPSFGYGTVHKGSVRGTHALPFHRLMSLRFLTTPLDELLDELYRLPLLDPGAKFKAAELAKTYERFLSRCPSMMVPIIEARRPPTPEEAPLFNLFLRTLGLDVFYHNPEITEQLELLMPIREEIEVVMTTEALNGEVAEYLTKAKDLRAPVDLVALYRQLYYDAHSITSHDLAYYMLLLRTSEHTAKTGAMGKSLAALSIEKGRADLVEATDILREIWNKAVAGFLNASKIKTPQALQAARAYIEPGLKAWEMLEGLDPTLKVAKAVDVLQIRDVTGPSSRVNFHDDKVKDAASSS